MSEIYSYASSLWAEMSADYQAVAEAEYAAAVTATNAYMVNSAGQLRGYTSWRVFTGNAYVRKAYGTQELQDHLAAHPRLTQAAYESQWLSNHLNRTET